SNTDIICKTGDIGRYNTNHDLEILGRNDDQIKINGVRIELAEVRNALFNLRKIRQVELVVHQGDDYNQELLCYYTGGERPAEDIRSQLQSHLPPTHIPSYFMWLEEFPLNLNGKVDRRALPKPEDLLREGNYEAP